jgi:hypothetical protein
MRKRASGSMLVVVVMMPSVSIRVGVSSYWRRLLKAYRSHRLGAHDHVGTVRNVNFGFNVFFPSCFTLEPIELALSRCHTKYTVYTGKYACDCKSDTKEDASD